MTYEEAVVVLDYLASLAPVSRAEHVKGQRAVQVLTELIGKNEESDKKDKK